MKKIYLLLCGLSLLVLGCQRQAMPQSSVVTGISVSVENGGPEIRLEYRAPNKMRAILNYLRWLEPGETAQTDPQALPGTQVRLVMHFSDGREKVYVQKADRFLQIDGNPWQVIDPVKAQTLEKMLGEMAGDGPESPISGLRQITDCTTGIPFGHHAALGGSQ